MSTELVAVQTAVAEFDKVAAGLAALQDKYGSVVYDVRTTQGMDDAKSARAAVREPRYAIEQTRKAAKAPILALGKQLDDRAKEITAAILKIEIPIDEQIKAEDARKEAEKQAKIDAELKRVSDIQARIETIRQWPVNAAGKPSSLVQQMLRTANDYQIDEFFSEFIETAQLALVMSRDALETIYTERLTHEAEQERIKAEREELARLRAEQESREAAERQRQAEETRKQQEIAAAEQRERNARIAKEDAERRARIDAENAEIAARKAELDRQELEARQAREAEAAREEAARIAAMPPPSPPAEVSTLCVAIPSESTVLRPTDAELALCVAVGYGVSTITSASWLRTFGQAEQVAA